MLKIVRINHVNHRWFHCSLTLGKRHSRPGATADVGLEESIIDKPPDQYPNIRQKLNRINYFDNAINTKNIGFEESSEPYQCFLNQAAHLMINHSKNKDSDDIDHQDVGVGDFDEKTKHSFLNRQEYDQLSNIYKFTKQYLDSTIQLAHHYSIFRDLFFQEPFENQTDRELIQANAKDEVKFYKFKHRELFQFIPLVPINAEFINLEQNDQQEKEVNCLQSFRGNLIPPEYGSQPPLITINTSGIIDKVDLSTPPTSSDSSVRLISGQKPDSKYYTLALVNLDSHFSDAGVCHWMLANIHQHGSQTEHETLVEYLPIYGIRGLGYHRYVLVLFQHDAKLQNRQQIQDFDLGKRKFNGLQFMSECSAQSQCEMKPVGLSWFQTTWSDNCKNIFHNILDMRCPHYEYVFPKQITHFDQLHYPARAPFNLYLDSFRDPKELSKEVLLERLKNIDPFESYETEKMYPTYDGRPKLPYIHPFPPNTPDWLKSTLNRKRGQIGRFRGLRASSAILPYNNNADLDLADWPRKSSDRSPLNVPNRYPEFGRRPKPLKETPWTKPLPEHHSLRVELSSDNLADEERKQYGKNRSS